jgi:hypothetical protein
VAGIFAWTSYYVWLPDIGSHSRNEVASVTAVNGDRLSLYQEWGDDFYTTYLEHRDVKGNTTHFIVDGDDIKRWTCSFREGPVGRIKIVYESDRTDVFDLNRNVLVRQDGIVVSPD